MSNDSNDSNDTKVLGDNAGVYIPQPKEKERSLNLSIDFGGFVVGLYQSALMSLGRLPHPETNQPMIDLESAKSTIDILRVLQQKTKNNLDQEEDRLLRGFIHELQVTYVEATS